jgi:hypothetical protein
MWLENLIGADIHNANEIHPEWQTLARRRAPRLEICQAQLAEQAKP